MMSSTRTNPILAFHTKEQQRNYLVGRILSEVISCDPDLICKENRGDTLDRIDELVNGLTGGAYDCR